MKKFTLLAAMAAVAMSATAQYNVTDPTTKAVAQRFPGATYDYVILDEDVATALKAEGCTMNYVGANPEMGQNLYIWPGGESLVAGEASEPGVDGGFNYMSLDAAQWDQAWQGGGFHNDNPFNFSHFTDATVLHIAYRTNTTCNANYFQILNMDGGTSKNGVCLGASVENNPVVGKAASEEWQAIELTLADLKKTVANANFGNLNAWVGNIIAFGGLPAEGWAVGGNLCLDAVYFVTPRANAIETIATTNDAAAVYYNLQGVRVMNPQNGVFIRKAGKEVSKVVL